MARALSNRIFSAVTSNSSDPASLNADKEAEGNEEFGPVRDTRAEAAAPTLSSNQWTKEGRSLAAWPGKGRSRPEASERNSTASTLLLNMRQTKSIQEKNVNTIFYKTN